MTKKKGDNKIKWVLVLILIVLVAVTINSSLRMKVKRPLLLTLRPIRSGFDSADSFMASLGEVVVNLNRWEKRMEELEKEKMDLLSENSELHQVEKENDVLRKALDMGLQKDFQLELSRVIGGRSEQHQIILNKGEEDGVKKGEPVIDSQKVLVGKVVQSGANTSIINLVSHPDSTFLVKSKEGKAEGELKGTGNLRAKLDFVPRDQEIKSGQVLVTDALGGDFPAGLLVGKIKEIEQKDVRPFQVAEVELYYEDNDDFLFVITDY